MRGDVNEIKGYLACLDITANELVLSVSHREAQRVFVTVSCREGMWHGRAPEHPGWGRGTVLGGNALPRCTPGSPAASSTPLAMLSPDITAQSDPDLILLQSN